jgi:hypothetical protein
MDLAQTFSTVFTDFADPKKRIFFGYLALSLLIAVLWLFIIKRQSIRTTLKRVFDHDVFLSRSAIADYQIFVINRAFTLFISPLLITQVAIATALYFRPA